MLVLQIAEVEAEPLNLASRLLQCLEDILETFITDLAFLEGKTLQWSGEEYVVEEPRITLSEHSINDCKLI